MITRTEQRWQHSLTSSFTQVDDLLAYLQLDPSLYQDPSPASQQLSLLLPREFAALIERGNPRDPILLQVLPQAVEMENTAGFSQDPLDEHSACLQPGLLQKYDGRVLWIATAACAIHCRYCFRRHFPNTTPTDNLNGWKLALQQVHSDSSIGEFILSGGDPLMLSDESLAQMVEDLENIPHLQRLRIHSRLPLLLPQRITTELIEILTNTRLRTLLVTHCNHANEISPQVAPAMNRLKTAGVTILNQAVLLRGVNDSAATLCDLSNALFDAHIMPYYLHLLDHVSGASHFALPLKEARELQRSLWEHLPGYLVPRVVYEQAGAKSKLPLI
jgi:L-lysine 2,3-aminomutase